VEGPEFKLPYHKKKRKKEKKTKQAITELYLKSDIPGRASGGSLRRTTERGVVITGGDSSMHVDALKTYQWDKM
jgi:hypothetical protein